MWGFWGCVSAAASTAVAAGGHRSLPHAPNAGPAAQSSPRRPPGATRVPVPGLLEDLCAGGELQRPGLVGCSLWGRGRKRSGSLAPRSASSRAGSAAPFLLSHSSSSFQRETKTNSGPDVCPPGKPRVSADPGCCLVQVSRPSAADTHSHPRGQHAPEAQPTRHLRTVLSSKHKFLSTDSLLSRNKSVLRGRSAHPSPGCFKKLLRRTFPRAQLSTRPS